LFCFQFYFVHKKQTGWRGNQREALLRNRFGTATAFCVSSE
jgi:hypothetical protein